MSEESQVEIPPQVLAWRKNAPYIYTLLSTIPLAQQSMTVEWFPEIDDKTNAQDLLLSTRTLGQSSEYLEIARTILPSKTSNQLQNYYDDQNGVFEMYNRENSAKFQIAQQIGVLGEINRARYMPQNPNIIAAMTSLSQVCIFDKTKYSSKPTGTFSPTITLEGHTDEGFGISWSSVQEGMLATGGNDSKVCVYNLKQYKVTEPTLAPRIFTPHGDKSVNDVQWHKFTPNILGSVGDDNRVVILDTRIGKGEVAHSEVGDEPSQLAFNPANEFLLAIGTDAGEVQLWDTRQLAKIHHLESPTRHNGRIQCMEWNPRHPAILATGSADTVVAIWDCARLETNDAMRFRHLGHESGVSDLSWNPAHDLMVASVAEESNLQIWQPIWV